jgi:hypothetical protein
VDPAQIAVRRRRPRPERSSPPWPARNEIRACLERFYCCAADADIPERTRLATTIETWWPEVVVVLQLRITNARTEGYNKTIKTIKWVGYRNQANNERRTLLNKAARGGVTSNTTRTDFTSCREEALKAAYLPSM